MSIIIHSTGPNCQRCTTVKRHMDKRGISYIENRIDLDIDQAKALRGRGFNLAPVIQAEINGETQWSEGYRPDFIDSLAPAGHEVAS